MRLPVGVSRRWRGLHASHRKRYMLLATMRQGLHHYPPWKVHAIHHHLRCQVNLVHNVFKPRPRSFDALPIYSLSGQTIKYWGCPAFRSCVNGSVHPSSLPFSFLACVRDSLQNRYVRHRNWGSPFVTERPVKCAARLWRKSDDVCRKRSDMRRPALNVRNHRLPAGV